MITARAWYQNFFKTSTFSTGSLLVPGPRKNRPLFYHLYKQDRISAINALAVSPKRNRLALYLQFRARNLTGLDIRAFLKHLLCHLRGPVVLLWDRGTIHRRKEVKQYLLKYSRLQPKSLPAYAPELNPSEYVWNQADRMFANSAPENRQSSRGFSEIQPGGSEDPRSSFGLVFTLLICLGHDKSFHYLCKDQ